MSDYSNGILKNRVQYNDFDRFFSILLNETKLENWYFIQVLINHFYFNLTTLDEIRIFFVSLSYVCQSRGCLDLLVLNESNLK